MSASFESLSPPPRVITGKFSASLLPAGAGDKGQAVEQLLSFSPQYRALYVGDDTTDEDVFVLHHLGIFTVRVGDDVPTAADYVIKGHEDIKLLLDLLLALLPEASQSTLIQLSARRQ